MQTGRISTTATIQTLISRTRFEATVETTAFAVRSIATAAIRSMNKTTSNQPNPMTIKTPDEQAFWDVEFHRLASDPQLSIHRAANFADAALAERRKRTGQPAEPTESPLAGFGEFVEKHKVRVLEPWGSDENWTIKKVSVTKKEVTTEMWSAPTLAAAYAKAREVLG